MTPDESKEFIQEVFRNVIENRNANEEIYSQYFSPNYTQYVDGKILNYTDFVSHMTAQKTVIASAKVNFKYIISEGDKIATVHTVEAVKHNGNLIEAQVNALFQIENRKILSCDELTHLIKGEKSDRDLGSRK